MRDEFKEKVKATLANRAGNVCSNPECGRRTSGAHEDPSRAVNIGVAAHISAASPGGPRFDRNLTEVERASITNGIWLCQVCAHLVDADAVKYTSPILREWKNLSEAAAQRHLQNLAPRSHSNEGIISFLVRIVDDGIWYEHSTEGMAPVFPGATMGLKRKEFVDQDPILDVTILNLTGSVLLLDRIGIRIDGVADFLVGFGAPEFSEIFVHAEYAIQVPDLTAELAQLAEARKKGTLGSYANRDLIVLLREDFPEADAQEFRPDLLIENLNYPILVELPNPIKIAKDGSFRYRLKLAGYDIWVESLIRCIVSTNQGIFSSTQSIHISMLPGD